MLCARQSQVETESAGLADGRYGGDYGGFSFHLFFRVLEQIRACSDIEMPRISLVISYDGTEFLGWQSQPHRKSVQDAVEAALRAIGEPSRVVGAGRTDAGVHALGQVAHFDAAKNWEPSRLVLALNAYLPSGVSVMRAMAVNGNFHARRDAISREYRYFIWNSPTCYPYIKPYALWLTGSHYNWRAGADAARLLVGEHDFGAFCRRADKPDNTVRRVEHAKLFRRGKLVVFRIVADSYLTNMVRIAVGNLISVASGRRDKAWLGSLLGGAPDRKNSSETVPACGLFLWKVTYP